MPYIVTRQQAMDHLKIDDATAEADDLDLKILAASAVVLDYIEREASDYEETTSDSSSSSSSTSSGSGGGGTPEYDWPYQLQAATLLLVGDMHRYRNADELKTYTEALLPPAVRALLYPLKTFGLDEENTTL